MKFIQILNRHTQKIAVVCGSLFLFELIIHPMTAMALTSGPTSPEATSFEPVDTTDMVNPLTGSFTYNLPLLEVPGPDGGYPLSLSYHAGIRPDVEASWVGLGWSLNPGAINRNVAGLPDDFKEVSLKRRDYWEGGNSKEYGLQVGFASVVNVGLVFASDTYRGFGVGASIGYGIKAGPANLGVDVGVAPYGGGFVGIDISSGTQVTNGLVASGGIGFSTNFQSLNNGAGVSLAKHNGTDNTPTSMLSASMSSSSNKPSLSIMGGTGSVFNNNAGKISTSSSGFGFTVPLGVISIGASFRSIRYWIDETVEVPSIGSLYTPIYPLSSPMIEWANNSFDNYRLIPDNINIADNPEDFELLGGTFPEYDNYSISAQGIGGQIRPFLYQRALHTQFNEPGKSQPQPNMPNPLIKQGVGFRFVNDFSNSFDQELDDVVRQSGVPGAIESLPFSMGSKPDNRIRNELTSSKFIKYFTNDEIRSGGAKANGFIDVGNTAKGFHRITNGTSLGNAVATKGGSQIGGFMVTNESGVTYHYALPAYSYNEYSYNYTAKDNVKFTETTRKEPYAYTWLLTAVTGPDYVDRNGNGVADETDWGYWVAIDYGQWTSDYVWRTPAEGADKDLDQNYSMYTTGQKELYYINRIRTRTHTAIFEKEVRFDAKANSINALRPRYIEGGLPMFDAASRKSLRLNKIYLVNNSDADIVSESSEVINRGENGEFHYNVIDNFDIEKVGRNLVEGKSIRVIDFGYSYDLSKKTPNSFNPRKPDAKLGKLTLDGVRFRGKGGAELLPVTQFSYKQPDVIQFEATRSANNEFTTDNTTSLEVGMMIESAEDNPVYYGMITAVRSGGRGKIYTVMNGELLDNNITNINLRQTKNPNYCRDCQDVWGFYKGDINRQQLWINADLARRVTTISAKGTDAWNLRTISSPTGNSIELDYESNEFKETVFERYLSFPIKIIQKLDNQRYAVELPFSVAEFEERYSAGSPINGFFLGQIGTLPLAMINSNSGNQTCFYDGRYGTSNNTIILKYNQVVPALTAGNIRLPLDPAVNYGGGIRIKNVTNRVADGIRYTAEYQYRSNGISTGITSYLPYNVETGNLDDIVGANYKLLYKKILNQGVENVLKYAREIPGPGVMYQQVRIENKVLQLNGDSQNEGYTENYYRVLDKQMINRVVMQDVDWGKGYVHAVNLRISDFTTNIGDLLAIKYYDADGKLIKQIKNNYLYDEAVKTGDFRAKYKNDLASNFKSQGLITERFAEARYHFAKAYSDRTNIVMAAREQYPSVLLSSASQDFVNQSSESTENLGFDFYNGQPNMVLKKDSYGNRFLNQTGFAYQQYPEMGSRLANVNNKNMLSQVFSEISYKLDNSNTKVGVISGSKTVWSKDANVLTPTGTIIKQNTVANGQVWRKQREEVLEIPDQYGTSGILPIAQFALTNGYWKLKTGISMYNVYSKALEDYDRNNNYSANRFGYKNSKIVAGANFAKYGEVAFSSAEDELMGTAVTGEVSKGQGTVSSGAFHTGSKSLSLAAGATGFEYVVPVTNLTLNRTYIASVWVKNATNGKVTLYYEIDGVATAAPLNSTQSIRRSGNWNLVNVEIPISGGAQLKVYVKNEGSVSTFVDDFRFHPKNSGAMAYVYDNSSGALTYVLDHLNLFTRFEYDAMGRLIRTYKEQFGSAPYKINEYQQNYRINSSVYYNDELTEEIRKNDCTTGEGTLVGYTVAQGKYSSTISKGEANSKAIAEVNQYGQQYANTYGRCVSCKRYKVKIHRMDLQNLNLYINYRDCYNTFQSSSYQSFPTDANTGVYLVFYVCVNTSDTSIRFSHGQNQPTINLSSAEIELVGNCN
ncbi:DUF5977 domain-containing protein [Sphingobacterium thalpophilum]|uniref:DUF5977 domain-containing protein n=1 Tax=Sphingobacterium thalpophilum TaxID=259 RepID=UPI0031D1128D